MPSFVAGDTASKFVHTCKDNDTGTVIDLTGATVRLKWKGPDGILITRTMTITTAVGGVVEYQFAAGELFAPLMRFEVEITDALGKVVSSLDVLNETVRAELS